jgi:hypothetical protein
VANGQQEDNFARFVDFVNGAVNVVLVAIEQMATRPFRPLTIRRDGAAAWKAREGVHRLFETIEPPGRDSAALTLA